MTLRTLHGCAAVSIWAASVALSGMAHAAPSGGTAVLVRGKVYRVVGTRSILIREGEAIEQGARISTAQDGRVKILLGDQTQISLGPNSSIQLEPATPPAVNITHGQMRATVPPSKTPAPSAGTRPRFMVRTPSAVLGVRGTDFQVIFNASNSITSLLTYEGAVVMGRGPESLEAPDAIQVKPGRFSTLNPALARPTLPQKISPVQFQALKSQSVTESAAKIAPRAYSTDDSGSPVAPGLDPKLAMTDAPPRRLSDGVPPEGVNDPKTGSFAAAAGGYLDLRTGLYIPPPPGAAYDANGGVYLLPPAMGRVDSRTGEYQPPKGFDLDPKKGFVPVSGHEEKEGDPAAAKRKDRNWKKFLVAMGPNGLPMLPPPPPSSAPNAGAPLPPPPPPEPSSGGDPFCPNCAPAQPPPPLSTVPSTLLNFSVIVQ